MNLLNDKLTEANLKINSLQKEVQELKFDRFLHSNNLNILNFILNITDDLIAVYQISKENKLFSILANTKVLDLLGLELNDFLQQEPGFSFLNKNTEEVLDFDKLRQMGKLELETKHLVNNSILYMDTKLIFTKETDSEYILMIARDYTEKRNTILELKDLNEKYNSVLENSKSVIFEYNSNLGIFKKYPQNEKLYLTDFRNIESFINFHENNTDLQEQINNCLQNEQNITIESTIFVNNKIRYLTICLVSSFSKEYNSIILQIFSTDITHLSTN